MVVVGLDPGGVKAFGWAIVQGTFDTPEFVAGGVCSGARAAIAEICKHLHAAPDAVGIDSPLFWSAVGDRQADIHVRKLVCQAGGYSGTVSHVNSLRGACLVEGAIAAHFAKERWPVSRITEAHPKAMLAVSTEVRDFALLPALQGDGHHQRDAALAALTALAMLQRRHSWQDLALMESGTLSPLGVGAAYWFPHPSSTPQPTEVGRRRA